jgi:hypothetical protein
VIIATSFYGHDFGQPADVLYRPQQGVVRL